jgi:tRNA(Ile)-lysidine synthase
MMAMVDPMTQIYPSLNRRLSDFEMKVLRTIRKHRMIEAGDRILVAVSGGADSTALLLCLNRLIPRLQITLAAAHLNHRLRGPESDSDEEAVKILCTGLHLPLIANSLPEEQASALLAGNLEEKARMARYSFFRKASVQAETNKIALGHSQNDQAETVLLHFLRGSGLAGLAAIHPVVDGSLIRPLLESSRLEIEKYLADQKIPYREDSSNRNLHYRRNRVRHECIPYLEKHFNPKIVEALAREAELARESSDLLDRIGERELEAMKVEYPGGRGMPAFRITMLDPALAKGVLRTAIRQTRGNLRGITSRHIDSLWRLCRSRGSKEIVLPGGFTVRRDLENLVFGAEAPAEAIDFNYPLQVPGACVIPEAGMKFTAELAVPREPPSRESRAHLDPAASSGGMRLRPRREGDRYGGPGHRKIKKMLIDMRIDPSLRGRFPLLCAGDTVIWVPGFEPAKPFKAKNFEGECLIITAEKLRMTNDK